VDVGSSVKKAIDDWEQGDLESSMLHACNAVDGTAGKASPVEASGNKRFTDLLRENYGLESAEGLATWLDITSDRTGAIRSLGRPLCVRLR